MYSPAYSALAEYVRQIESRSSGSLDAEEPRLEPGVYSTLVAYAQDVETASTRSIATAPAPSPAVSTLLDYVQTIAGERPQLAAAEPTKAAAPAKRKATKAATPIDPGEATFVGSQVCLGCHASQASAFAQTLMGRIARTQKGKMECESCHGAGSLHVKLGGGRGAGGIISFRADDTSRTAEEHNAICLACHERGDRTYWRSSTHDTRGVACTNCHQVMRKVSVKHQLFKSTEVETCFQCHKLQRAQLQRSSHMPVREGKMTCSDCHNPHGSATDSLLKEVSLNDTCYKCHADKRGPFLWEHFPVRENCGNCHEPHGSNNEFLLKIAKPRLCYQCHTAAHGNPSNALAGTSFNRACTNCHSQIHGSNAPAGVLFQR